MAANDDDTTRGLNDIDSDSNHEVSENSDTNKINPDYASMAARLVVCLFFIFFNHYYYTQYLL